MLVKKLIHTHTQTFLITLKIRDFAQKNMKLYKYMGKIIIHKNSYTMSHNL